VLPSSTWGHQTTESTPAELHDKTAERGGGCGRGDDGERRRARSGEAGERDRVGGKEQVEWVVQVEAGIEEARRRKPYPLARAMPARRVRRGRARSASPGRRNRREARFGELGRPGWVRWADLLGWAEAQGEARGSPTPSSFLFFFSSSFCLFFLANNDFAELCHWPKQFQRIKVHCLKKVVRLLE